MEDLRRIHRGGPEAGEEQGEAKGVAVQQRPGQKRQKGAADGEPGASRALHPFPKVNAALQ